MTSTIERTNTSTPRRKASAPRPHRKARRSLEGVSWAAAAVLLVVALVPLALFIPEAAVLVIGGSIAVFASFRWPFVIAFAALASIVWSSVLEAGLGSAGGNIDEALTLLCVVSFTIRRIWLDRAVVLPGGTLWFGGFLAVGILASVLADVPLDVWTQQAFLSLKGFLLAFAFAQLEWRSRQLRGLLIGGAITAGLLIFTAAINVVAPGPWLQFTGARVAS